MRRFLWTIILLVSLCQAAEGSAPRKGAFLMYQPDGTSFMAMLHGDEFCKVLTTDKGYPIVKDADGFYRHAMFMPDGSRISTGYKVGDDVPANVLESTRAIPWKILRDKTAWTREYRFGDEPPYSNRPTRSSEPVKKHCIVILAQFPDISFMNGEARRDDILNLITKEGSKSVLDYFNDQFMGRYEFSFTIGPVVTLSKNHDYYGKNEDGVAGQDSNPKELVREACVLSDPQVDFSLFDDDGDGIVDNVFVIVAGKSEAEGADSDCLWPHQWAVDNLTLDGKRIRTYGLSTELTVHSQNSGGQLVWGLCNIGTFCHEYSHTLGLRDYYDTDEKGSGGEAKGMWEITALMDGGNFNDSGKTPPAYNAVDREFLGIGKPETMALGKVTLEPISENGRYLILENPADHDEFFLFECRAQKGWDTYIGAGGLAIYHVDMSKNHNALWSDDAGREVTAAYRWNHNEINNNPSYECADMIETSSGAIEVRQAFFPFRTINSFSANSTPAFKFNDGTEPPFAISNITRSGNNVTFTVYNSADIVPKPVEARAEVYQDAAIISWSSDVEDFDGDATISWGPSSGNRKTEVAHAHDKGKYSFTLEGLSPTTAYSVEIFFERNGVTGETVVIDFLTKAQQTNGKPYIYLEYLAPQRISGKFPAGVGLPLRVFNAIGKRVSWTYDGTQVKTDGSGYFHPTKSGTLKATITNQDGSKDIIAKEIIIGQ